MQVKVSHLARGQVRQRGIQEIDGVSIARSVTVTSAIIDKTVDRLTFTRLAESGSHGRKGPVFLELPLDIQGAKVGEPEVKAASANVPELALKLYPRAS